MAEDERKLTDSAHGMVLAHVLFVDIVGYSKELTPDQADWLELLIELTAQCPSLVSARAEERVIAAPSGDGYALAFFDAIDDPIRCGEELLALVDQAGKFRIRLATHFGPVEVVEDISGSPNVSGEGINLASRALKFTEPGALYLTERSYEIAREVPDLADRFQWVGDETAKHGVELSLYRLVAPPDHPAYSAWDLRFAQKIYERARRRKRSGISPVGKIAERVAHIRHHLITGLVLFLVVECIHHGAELTDFGVRMRLWAYDKLQPNMPAPEGKLPIVVADLQDNFALPLDDDRKTDMKKVAEFLSGIADHHEATGEGPLAIGIDIQFGSEEGSVFPDAEGDVIAQAKRLGAIQPRPIPVYLAVSKGLARGRDLWLQRPDFSKFVAHPQTPGSNPNGLTQLIDTLIVGEDRVPSLVGQLAEAYQLKYPPPPQLPDWIVDRHAEPLEVPLGFDEKVLALKATPYFLNFGALDRLKRESLTIRDASDASDPQVQERLSQSVVLIGRTTDKDDLWSTQSSKKQEAGVYFHALGVFTKVQSPISEFRPWLSTLLALVASLFVLGVTSAVRVSYAWAAPEVDDQRLRKWCTLGLIALTLSGSVWLIRTYGILWTDYLLVAIAIAGDPILEGWTHGAATTAYRWSQRTWRRFVFKGEAH